MLSLFVKEKDNKSKVHAVLFGLALGDAVGVPVEFIGRQYFKQRPVTDMTGYGTHNVPSGTFSDDSSLAFCLAEALLEDFNLHTIAGNFVNWKYHGYWTALGTVFDIGITTSDAISRLKAGTQPEMAGGFGEDENGNGSLMRILPLVFYIKDKPIAERYMLTRLVSSLTHGHIRSVICCFYYLEFAKLLIEGNDKFDAYKQLKGLVTSQLDTTSINPSEIKILGRLLQDDIYTIPEDEIGSSGYVLHTLEASIWCLLTTDNYKDAVLKAVNLGNDTDTTATVTGGLAGLLYGYNSIPKEWVNTLARSSDIEDLANRLANKFLNNS